MGREDGGSFEAGIEMALSGVLMSPSFLFRNATTPDGVAAGEVYQLTDFELASRLSFFLWSSIPDEELLELVENLISILVRPFPNFLYKLLSS